MTTILSEYNPDFLYHMAGDDYTEKLITKLWNYFRISMLVIILIIAVGVIVITIVGNVANKKYRKEAHLDGVVFSFDEKTKLWTATDKTMKITVIGADLWDVTKKIRDIKQCH